MGRPCLSEQFDHKFNKHTLQTFMVSNDATQNSKQCHFCPGHDVHPILWTACVTLPNNNNDHDTLDTQQAVLIAEDISVSNMRVKLASREQT